VFFDVAGEGGIAAAEAAEEFPDEGVEGVVGAVELGAVIFQTAAGTGDAAEFAAQPADFPFDVRIGVPGGLSGDEHLAAGEVLGLGFLVATGDGREGGIAEQFERGRGPISPIDVAAKLEQRDRGVRFLQQEQDDPFGDRALVLGEAGAGLVPEAEVVFGVFRHSITP